MGLSKKRRKMKGKLPGTDNSNPINISDDSDGMLEAVISKNYTFLRLNS